MMTSSISSAWKTGSSAQSSKVWTDRKVEQEAKSKAAEARREVAEDKVQARDDWQAARSQWSSKTSSVDMYM
jgi:hypothetical protein